MQFLAFSLCYFVFPFKYENTLQMTYFLTHDLKFKISQTFINVHFMTFIANLVRWIEFTIKAIIIKTFIFTYSLLTMVSKTS